MSNLNLAISDDEIGWAQSRVAAGEFASIDAYFSQLAQRDRAEAEEAAWLQEALEKGIASGVDERSSAQIFSDIRTKYLDQNG
jgi:antitoxin ParD1/3/4